MVGVTDLDLALRLADCVVIVTDHSGYDWQFIQAYQERLVDTRHMIGDKRWDKSTLTSAAATDTVEFIPICLIPNIE